MGVGGTINAGAISTTGAVTGVSGSVGSLTVSNGSGQTVLVSSVEPSTSTTTGAVRVVGGVGVGGTINAGALSTAGAVTGGSGSLGSLTISNGSGQTVLVSSTQASTSTTTGCARFNGGIGVAGRVSTGGSVIAAEEIAVVPPSPTKAEFSVYNQGSVTEWVMGQRSGSDHEFTLSSRVSGVYTERARFNLSGQLRLGTGSFFGYFEGSWTPVASSTADPLDRPTITYSVQYGRYTVVGKQATLSYRLRFSYSGHSTGQWLLIQGIPSDLRLNTSVQDVTAPMSRNSNWGGLTNPIDTTLWTNGYDLTGVAVMDGLTMTVGAWTSGSYVTGAYLIGGASNQDLWGHLTYLLP